MPTKFRIGQTVLLPISITELGNNERLRGILKRQTLGIASNQIIWSVEVQGKFGKYRELVYEDKLESI